MYNTCVYMYIHIVLYIHVYVLYIYIYIHIFVYLFFLQAIEVPGMPAPPEGLSGMYVQAPVRVLGFRVLGF